MKHFSNYIKKDKHGFLYAAAWGDGSIFRIERQAKDRYAYSSVKNHRHDLLK